MMRKDRDQSRQESGMKRALPVLAAAALVGSAAALGLSRGQGGEPSPAKALDPFERPKSHPWMLLTAATGLGLIAGLLLPRTEWERVQVARAGHAIGARVEDRLAAELWTLVKTRAGI